MSGRAGMVRSGKSTAGDGSLILNADSLKSLLTTASDPRVDPYTRKAAVNRNLEITDKIMRQETGIRARRFRKRLNRASRSEKKTLLDRPIKAYGIDQVRHQRLAALNVFEFAATFGLDREDIEYLDRQLLTTKRNVSQCSEKLILGFEHLNGAEAENLSFSDAEMLLLLMGHDELNEIFHNMANRVIQRHEHVLSIPVDCQSERTLHNNNNDDELHQPQNDEEVHDVASAMVDRVLHTAVEHELRHEAEHDATIEHKHQQQQNDELPTAIKFENYLTAFECYLRLRAMALSLGEMRGWAQRSSYQQLFKGRPTEETYGGILLEESRDETSISQLNQDDGHSALGGYSASLDDFNTSADIDEQMFVANSTMRPRSQPTRRPYIEHDSLYNNNHHLPESNSERTHSGGAVNRGLPPLKLRKRHAHQEKVSRKMLAQAGFDATFSRATPRVLHSKSSSVLHVADSSSMTMASTAEGIEQLRMELTIAQEGLKHLNKMVDTNIAWVQSNCDVSAVAPNFSDRTKQKCKMMAAERIGNVLDDWLERSLFWAFDRWRTASRYDAVLLTAKQYSKLKGIEMLSHTLHDAVSRQLLRGWTRWLSAVQSIIAAERDAACTHIQRIVRGFLGRRRFNNIKLGKSALVMQNLFRRKHALAVVENRRYEKEMEINGAAAVVLQKLFHQLHLMREAQAEVRKRREQRAITKIQKIQRGKQGRKRVSEIMSRTGPRPGSESAIKKQQETEHSGYRGSDLEGLSKTLPSLSTNEKDLNEIEQECDVNDNSQQNDAVGSFEKDSVLNGDHDKMTSADKTQPAKASTKKVMPKPNLKRKPLYEAPTSTTPIRELCEKEKRAKAEKKAVPKRNISKSPPRTRSRTPPMAATTATLNANSTAPGIGGAINSKKWPTEQSSKPPQSTRVAQRMKDRSKSPAANSQSVTTQEEIPAVEKSSDIVNDTGESVPSDEVPDSKPEAVENIQLEEPTVDQSMNSNLVENEDKDNLVANPSPVEASDDTCALPAPIDSIHIENSVDDNNCSHIEDDDRPPTPPPADPTELLKKEKSIVNIQKLARGKIARKQTEIPLKKRKESVQVIQKVARGKIARKDVSQRRSVMSVSPSSRSRRNRTPDSVSTKSGVAGGTSSADKAIKIQKIARGKLARAKSRRMVEEKAKAASNPVIEDLGTSIDGEEGSLVSDVSNKTGLKSTENPVAISDQADIFAAEESVGSPTILSAQTPLVRDDEITEVVEPELEQLHPPVYDEQHADSNQDEALFVPITEVPSSNEEDKQNTPVAAPEPSTTANAEQIDDETNPNASPYADMEQEDETTKESFLGSFCRILSPSRGGKRSRSGSPFSSVRTKEGISTASPTVDNSSKNDGLRTDGSQVTAERREDGKLIRTESRGKEELQPIARALSSPVEDIPPQPFEDEEHSVLDQHPGSPLLERNASHQSRRPILSFDTNEEASLDTDELHDKQSATEAFMEAPVEVEEIDAPDNQNESTSVHPKDDAAFESTHISNEVPRKNPAKEAAKEKALQKKLLAEEKRKEEEAKVRAAREEREQKEKKEKEKKRRRSFTGATNAAAVSTSKATGSDQPSQPLVEAAENAEVDSVAHNIATAATTSPAKSPRNSTSKERRGSFTKASTGRIPSSPASGSRPRSSAQHSHCDADKVTAVTSTADSSTADSPRNKTAKERRGSFSKASTGRLPSSPASRSRPQSEGQERQSPLLEDSDRASPFHGERSPRSAVSPRSKAVQSPALEDKEYAAKRIQQLARHRQARSDAKKQAARKRDQIALAQKRAGLLIHWAVITLQRNWRGRQGRKRYVKHAMAKQAELAQKQLAGAIKIQTRARGARDRERVAAIRRQREEERKRIEWMRSYQKEAGMALGQPSMDEEPKDNNLDPVSDEDNFRSNTFDERVTSPDVEETDVPNIEPTSAPDTAPVTMPTLGKNVVVSKEAHKPPVAPKHASSADETDEGSVKNVSTHGSMSGLGLNETAGSSALTLQSGGGSELVDSIEEKIRKLEALERSIHEKEQSMILAAKVSEERAAAMEKALQQMEERNKKEEADRLAREQLLAIAAGPISHRSEYSSLRGSARGVRGRSSLPGTARSRHSAPPTARSAQGVIPLDAPRMQHNGEEWVQLWDNEEGAYYWYCERTQAAQWETPGEEEYYDDNQYLGEVREEDSGYESAGAMTDYSTDHYDEYSRGDVSDAEYAYGGEGIGYAEGGYPEWEEYYDEQAQANYWYNNITGEASWTRPDAVTTELSEQASIDGSSQRSIDPMALVPSATTSSHNLDDASAWVSYIDPITQQAYWYNVHTGDTSWA